MVNIIQLSITDFCFCSLEPLMSSLTSQKLLFQYLSRKSLLLDMIGKCSINIKIFQNFKNTQKFQNFHIAQFSLFASNFFNSRFCLEILFFTLILYPLYLVSILPELILNLRFFGFSQITLGGLEKKMKIFYFCILQAKNQILQTPIPTGDLQR